MQEKLFSILFNEEEITWQSMIYQLVRQEGMDPWDVDVSLLSQRFLEMLRKFKEMDFRVSGKILLAAAILLKLKSTRLLDHEIGEFDRMMQSSDTSEEEFYDDIEQELAYQRDVSKMTDEEKYKLIPRTPQPRSRKVSVHDLVDALNKALEVKHRRVRYSIPEISVEIPEKQTDMSVLISNLYMKIKGYFQKKNYGKLNFSQLIPSESKEDKIYTFMPLLHLTNQRKIDLEQEQHFGEIEIVLLEKKAGNELKT